MNKYELIFIVDSRLSDAEKSDVSKQVTDLIAKTNGKIINRPASRCSRDHGNTYRLL